MSLHPTKTRLDLLAAVEAGLVIDGLTEDTDGHVWWTDDIDPPRKVTARVEELLRAGWVHEVEAWYCLTSAGKIILDTHQASRKSCPS